MFGLYTYSSIAIYLESHKHFSGERGLQGAQVQEAVPRGTGHRVEACCCHRLGGSASLKPHFSWASYMNTPLESCHYIM